MSSYKRISRSAYSANKSSKSKEMKQERKVYARKPALLPPNQFDDKHIRRVASTLLHKEAENNILVTAITQSIPNTRSIAGSGLDWNGTTGNNGRVYLNVIPSVTVGSGQGGRKGNTINPRSFQLRGVVTTNLQTPVTLGQNYTPFYLHMFVYTLKGNLTNSDTSQILQGGTAPGSSLPFDGSLLKSTYPFNKDAYNIVKHRIFKMASAPSLVNAVSPAVGTSDYLSGDGWGNGFKLAYMFKMNLPHLKFWKYNDQITNVPTNQNYYVGFAVVNCDGTTNPIGVSRANVDMESVLQYEDF